MSFYERNKRKIFRICHISYFIICIQYTSHFRIIRGKVCQTLYCVWSNNGISCKIACAFSEDSDPPAHPLLEVRLDLLVPWLPIECPTKTLIRLSGCADWSESWLGEQSCNLVGNTLSQLLCKIHRGVLRCITIVQNEKTNHHENMPI